MRRDVIHMRERTMKQSSAINAKVTQMVRLLSIFFPLSFFLVVKGKNQHQERKRLSASKESSCCVHFPRFWGCPVPGCLTDHFEAVPPVPKVEQK